MLKIRDFVDAKLYSSEEEVIQDALRHLLRDRPNLKIQLAIFYYQTKEISLAKAAHIAGVSWDQMKEILIEHGIQPRLGASSASELEDEIKAVQNYFGA